MKSLFGDALGAVADGWLRTRIIFFALIPSCSFDLPSDFALVACSAPSCPHISLLPGENLSSLETSGSSKADPRKKYLQVNVPVDLPFLIVISLEIP